MYNKLTEAQLKTGERMEVGVIIAPDEEHAEAIKPFLAHKGGYFQWHIQRCVSESLDALETRFYVGKVDGEIITNIMIVEHRHVGILGHVFTTPAQRRKGACKSVMGSQMEDFRQRGGEALYLGTGYNSHPYYIYHGFGFESVYSGSGFMKYHAIPDFDEHYFAVGDVHAKEVEWHDWAKTTALTGIVEGDYLRSIAWSIYGPTNFEGEFLGVKHDLEETDAYHDAKLLESDSGAIVGKATVTWDRRWQPHTAVLDLFVHPNFWASSSVLLEAIKLPDAKVQCYVESTATDKAHALEKTGFHHEATLKNQIQHPAEGDMDVLVFARR
ncbi:MAG: GNAT family N-acetyltransferase [Candidatus Poribacteria bacterium]|nr:GNAT family N-acetyltransferase [Candidatus Poribacteria bacterium]